jgi:transcription elongation factor Elf1
LVLTDKQKEILKKKLDEIVKQPITCAVCNNTTWSIADSIFEIREFHGGSMVIGGKSRIVPIIIMSCSVCGQILFFNAMSLGIVEPASPQKPEERK